MAILVIMAIFCSHDGAAKYNIQHTGELGVSFCAGVILVDKGLDDVVWLCCADVFYSVF